MDRKRKAEELNAPANDNDNDNEDNNETNFVEGETSDGEPSAEEIKSDDEEFYKELREKKKKTRVYRSGPKSAFTGTDNDKDDKLDQALFNWINAIKAPKTQSIRSISLANWNDETQRAEVYLKKGKHFQTIGTDAPHDRVILYIEEALYLVDHGLVELYYHGVPMSSQQVYHLLDQVNFPLEHYQVYSYLRRFGYIVMRTSVYDEEEDSEDDNTNNNQSNDNKMNIDSTATNIDVNNSENNNNNVNNNNSGDDIMNEDKVEQKVEDNNEEPIETDNTNDSDAFWRRIQLIGPASSQRIEKLSTRSANKTPFAIHYDVYKPSKRQNFRKTSPGDPSYRISICKFNQAPPSLREIEELSLLSHPVPVKFCVVNDGVINYLGMQPIVTDMILN